MHGPAGVRYALSVYADDCVAPMKPDRSSSLSEWYEGVVSAAKRLSGKAHLTPLYTSRTLDRMVGASVFLKCENLQRGGAFKFRGAFNAMSRLTPAQRKKGVVTHSSGNHAQAVALTGALLNIRTTVVMPHDALEASGRPPPVTGPRWWNTTR